MGSKNKLKRFKENETFSNLIQPNRESMFKNQFNLRGNWNSTYFKNDNPIVLELGCGKGEYTLYFSELNPEINYIGIDIKGARIWRGAKTAFERGLKNVAFLRTQIELLTKLFSHNEVNEIWITFPDPQIKLRRAKHRLTNPEFLSMYKKILKSKGSINVKTDSDFFYGYTLGIIQGLGGKVIYSDNDIYKNPNSPTELTKVQTFYERTFLNDGKKISFIKFCFD
ncbi:MAG: tRNA (guanosine(46)-N7)-methyltransferase TrmB [Bacteroidota bacterium]|nr:tRNA (guanosine(46)-N7)-methyltransferase TrmB [Bacteroidota bacterium]